MNQNPSLAEPCPFCSGDMHVIEDRGDNNCEPLLYRPQCKACGAGLGGFGKRPDAIDAWNTRAERLEAGTWQPGREEVARIIEPSAFKRQTRHHSRVYRNASLAEGRTDAFAKADAILALPPTPAPGGGER